MSLLRSAELRVGLCPDRLVLAKTIVPISGIEELRAAVAGQANVTVILSNHFVRYVVLPWTNALSSETEWQAYAGQAFADIYGKAAADWRIRFCGTGHRAPRVASAVDAQVLESLEAIPGLRSIQPYLMAGFNARRKAVRGKSGWFVLQEPGRLALSLLDKGAWKLIRTRQVPADWRESLAGLLDREIAASEEPDCDEVLVCAEDEVPPQLGRYRLHDLTLPHGAHAESRRHVMALH